MYSKQLVFIVVIYCNLKQAFMLRDIRKQYNYSRLTEEIALKNPYEQFNLWLMEAIESGELEPTAMALSTVDNDLQPHTRIVLLKDFSEKGLVFYTNYEGNKAKDMDINNKVSALFFWRNQERQVRITGNVSKLDAEITKEYFKTRPIDSQLGAWASPQSRIIPSMEYLESQFETYQKEFGDHVPSPEHWGGYIIKPNSFEFWQGRPNRLHDRLYYTLTENMDWKIVRLAP